MPFRSRIQSVVNAVAAKLHHMTDGGKMTLYAAPVPLSASLRPADDVEITTRAALDELTDVERDALLTGSASRVRAEREEFAKRFERGARWVFPLMLVLTLTQQVGYLKFAPTSQFRAFAVWYERLPFT